MNKALILVFIAALILRLSLVFVAFHGDLNNNISWGKIAAESDLSGFYEREDWPYSAPNQPPLTIITFAASRVIWQVVEDTSWWLNNNFKLFYSPFIWFWEDRGMTLLVKLPATFADLGIGWLIYKYLSKKKKKLALTLSAVWLFNPIVWYNSSIWGQTDSVVNFLGLAAILFLLKKRLILFSVLFTLSLLFKGSLAIFIPILLLIAVWQKYSLEKWLKAVVSSLGVVILASIWFHPKLDLIFWLINLYKDRILPGEIGYLTANAFNFWWLVDPGRTLDSTIYLGLSARLWGLGIALGGIVAAIFWLKEKVSDKRIFLTLVFTTLLTFLFMTRIHERYLYPLFPYVTMLLGLVPGLAFPFIILSATHLLNLYHLFWIPPFAPLEALYQNPIFPQSISVVNTLTFIYIIIRQFSRVKL